MEGAVDAGAVLMRPSYARSPCKEPGTVRAFSFAMRLVVRLLVLAILGLGEIGGDAWVGMLHVLTCHCCETEAGSCCSRKSAEETPSIAERGCACAIAPADPSPASAPVVADTPLPVPLAYLAEIPAAWIEPATPVFHPPEPRGRTSRFLFGSGGERTAFLGTARL